MSRKFNPYRAPSQEIFEDLKKNAIKIWEEYSNESDYIDEKLEKVNSVVNFKDNAWALIGMFDSINQHKLLSMVDDKTRLYILNMLGI